VSLLCGFFALLGVGSLLNAFSYATLSGRIPNGQPQSVELFLTLFPFLMMLLGFLGLFAALSLWTGHPLGRTSGLAWIGLWIVEELLMAIWSVAGPEVIRQAASGIGGNLLRIAVGGALFYYLWTTGATYVESAGEASSP
jgi:hypothetical protein